MIQVFPEIFDQSIIIPQKTWRHRKIFVHRTRLVTQQPKSLSSIVQNVRLIRVGGVAINKKRTRQMCYLTNHDLPKAKFHHQWKWTNALICKSFSLHHSNISASLSCHFQSKESQEEILKLGYSLSNETSSNRHNICLVVYFIQVPE